MPTALDVAKLVVDKEYLFRRQAQGIDRKGIGTRVRLENAVVRGIDDRVELTQHLHAGQEFLAVEQRQFIAQDADLELPAAR